MKHVSEALARSVDACCKIIATLGIVIGGLVGLFSYLSTRDHEAYARAAEANKPMLEERLNECVNITRAASLVATTDDPKERKSAAREFTRLFVGPLELVDDNKTFLAAGQFKDCIERTKQCTYSLIQLSANLAGACRTSLGPQWGSAGPEPPRDLKLYIQ